MQSIMSFVKITGCIPLIVQCQIYCNLLISFLLQKGLLFSNGKKTPLDFITLIVFSLCQFNVSFLLQKGLLFSIEKKTPLDFLTLIVFSLCQFNAKCSEAYMLMYSYQVNFYPKIISNHIEFKSCRILVQLKL